MTSLKFRDVLLFMKLCAAAVTCGHMDLRHGASGFQFSHRSRLAQTGIKAGESHGKQPVARHRPSFEFLCQQQSLVNLRDPCRQNVGPGCPGVVPGDSKQ